MQNDNRKVTIDDIARELNISKTTVSRAISGKGRVGKDTVQRVNDYIEHHNYYPSAIARSLATQRSSNIAFVMNEAREAFDMPYLQKFLWGVTERASELGYDVLICMASGDDISQLQRIVSNKKIDGAIVARAIENDKAVTFLENAGVPYAVFDFELAETYINRDMTAADFDAQQSGRDAADNLIRKMAGERSTEKTEILNLN